MQLEFRMNTSSKIDLIKHLLHCDSQFIPALSTRVFIDEYATKIYDNAVLFEAWDCEILIGLLALYVNSNNNGFISNVSVYKESSGKGVATTLFKNLISYSLNSQLSDLKLEVNELNYIAISLYKKFGFLNLDRKGDQIIMKKVFFSI